MAVKRDPRTATLSAVRYEFTWPDGSRTLAEYTPEPCEGLWHVRVDGNGGPAKSHVVRMQHPTMENARKLAARFGQ